MKMRMRRIVVLAVSLMLLSLLVPHSSLWEFGVGTASADHGTCGNNILEHGEVCDDGNTANGDTCSSDCKISNVNVGDEQCAQSAGTCQTVAPRTGGYFTRGLCNSNPSETYQCFVPTTSIQITGCASCIGAFQSEGAWCDFTGNGYCAVRAGGTPTCVAGYTTIRNGASCPGPPAPAVIIIRLSAESPAPNQPFSITAEVRDTSPLTKITITVTNSNTGTIADAQTCNPSGTFAVCTLQPRLPEGAYIAAVTATNSNGHTSSGNKPFAISTQQNTQNCQACQAANARWCTSSIPSSTQGTCVASGTACSEPYPIAYFATPCPQQQNAIDCQTCQQNRNTWCTTAAPSSTQGICVGGSTCTTNYPVAFPQGTSCPTAANTNLQGLGTCQLCQNAGGIWCTSTTQPSITSGTCQSALSSCLGPINTAYPPNTACPGATPQQPGVSACQQCNFAAAQVWCAPRNQPSSGFCTTIAECGRRSATHDIWNSCPATGCRELCQPPGVIGGIQSFQAGRILISSFCGQGAYGVSGYGVPGGYGYSTPGVSGLPGQTGISVATVYTPPGVCNPGEACNCVYTTTTQPGGFVGVAINGGTTPGSNVAPRSGWTDPDELQNPPRATPNTPICEKGKDASIRGNLQAGSTALVRAGDSVTITGEVEKLTAVCEGYQYECRPFREVGCTLKNRVYWTNLDYDKCPGNFNNVLHQEGGGETNVNWAMVGITIGIIVGGFALAGAAAPAAGAGAGAAGAGAGAAGAGAGAGAAGGAAAAAGGFSGAGALQGAAIGGSLGQQIDSAEGQPQLARCFRVCGGAAFLTDPAPSPVCSGGRSQVSVIGSKKADVKCSSAQNCGPFKAKKIRIRVFDPNGVLVKEDFTATDAEGKFSYTFRAPPGDGEFSVVASVPVEG